MTPNDDLGTTETGNIILLNKNNIVKTNKKFVCKIYKVYNDTEYTFISTRQENCNKYLNNVKNRTNKKNDKLVKILNTTYNIEFIENFEYIDKSFLIEKLNVINTQYRLTNNKELDLKYGLNEEQKVLIKIQNYFINDDIVKCSNQFSVFDYMGLKSQCLFELKTNRDKFTDYPNAIFGTNKIIKNQKQIFLFQFETATNEKDLYYFIKPDNFEVLYNKREIFLKFRNISNWVYDIPRSQLIKINKNETCKLDITNTNNELFTHFYNLEKVRADTEH